MDRTFTLVEARELIPTVWEIARELVPVRAELAGRVHAHNVDGSGSVADIKAAEARMSELLDRLTSVGIQVKSYAPLLIDFPHRHEGRDVLLCWLEGESELGWFHEVELGFMGRRDLDELR